MNEKDIEKRNDRLKIFFEDKGINVKIIGDINKPAVVYEQNHICLCCYVHNFELIFTDKPVGGNELFRVKLTEKVDNDHNEEIENWFYNIKHKDIYRVAVDTDEFSLFLTGFHKTINDEYVPVFCEVNPKYYFTREKAEEVAKKHSGEEIKLIVI
jgi:hypothetical protein